MAGETTLSARSGKELYEATRPFAKESRARSWWCTVSTFALLLVVLTGLIVNRVVGQSEVSLDEARAALAGRLVGGASLAGLPRRALDPRRSLWALPPPRRTDRATRGLWTLDFGLWT